MGVNCHPICLHVRVIRAFAALGNLPIDVLGRILDVAGFAVDAILVIDLETWFFAVFAHHFVDSSRTITLGRLVPGGQVCADWYLRVFELEVNWLVFFVVRGGEGDVGETVKRDHAIGLRVKNWFRCGSWNQGLRIRFAVFPGPKAKACECAEPHISGAESHAAGKAKFRPHGFDVLDAIKVFIDPRIFEGLFDSLRGYRLPCPERVLQGRLRQPACRFSWRCVSP